MAEDKAKKAKAKATSAGKKLGGMTGKAISAMAKHEAEMKKTNGRT